MNWAGRMSGLRLVTSVEIDVHRQAISRSVKLSAVIWSSGEYLVFVGSAPKARHSPTGSDACA